MPTPPVGSRGSRPPADRRHGFPACPVSPTRPPGTRNRGRARGRNDHDGTSLVSQRCPGGINAPSLLLSPGAGAALPTPAA